MSLFKLASTCFVLALVPGCKNVLPEGPKEIRLLSTLKPVNRDVEFVSSGGIKLKGTLTLPAGAVDQRYPAVLMLPGSGPTDRDGNQPGFKTDVLKQVAVGLAAANIASFRFDKRATASNASQWPKSPTEFGPFFSWANHIADVRAAWNAMVSDGSVDTQRCAILGHSEGGILALAVSGTINPKALVLLATPGRKFDDVVEEQLTFQLTKANDPALKERLLRENRRVSAHIAKTGQIPKDVPIELRGLYNPSVGVYLQQLSRIVPSDLARKFKGPVLLLVGESDVQVNPSRDVKALAKVLQEAPGRTVAMSVLPLASHSFKPVDSPDDPGIEGEVVPDLIEEIHTFLVPLIGGKKPDHQAQVR